MNLPTLYKKTSAGAIEQWTIGVKPLAHPDFAIITNHGQVGGKLIESVDRITEGKNLGKANETTVKEQAEKEAKARWTKKIERNGYVEDQARAAKGETDQEGGIAPMLAKPHEDVAKKLKAKFIFQKKLNGVRCIAVVDDDGTVTLWSRKREAIVMPVPHIIKALEKLKLPPGTILDGELYVHGWTLQKIASYVRQKTKPKDGHERVEYHVYDMPSSDLGNEERDTARMLLLFGAGCELPIVVHESYTVTSVEEAWKLHDEWVRDGYEGGIARNPDAKYQAGKRSADLQKFKRFDEHEFEVTGSAFGRGKYSDIPVLVCKTDEGKEFDCNPPGTLEERRAVDRNAVVGKKLTVKHFGWTDDKLPAFPVGVVFRDYE
jgi:ATP-dependent DNA ligase